MTVLDANQREQRESRMSWMSLYATGNKQDMSSWLAARLLLSSELPKW